MNPRDFEAIVGAEHVETGGRPLDAVLPVASVRPGSADEVAAVLRVAGEQGAVVVVRGGGSKLAWGNPLAADAFISLETARLVEPVDLRPDEGIATLGAGLRLAALAEAAADCGQTSRLVPLHPGATVGGTIAVDPVDPGWDLDRRLRGDLLGLEVVLASGEITRCGGQVVKNVTGFDLVRLYCGSHGTLGVITRATLRLRARPDRTLVLRREHPNLARALESAGALAGSGVAPAGAVVHPGPAGAALVWRLEGSPASIERGRRRFQGDLAGPDVWLAAEAARVSPPAEGISLRLAARPTDTASLAQALASHGARIRLVLPLAGVVFAELAESALLPLLERASSSSWALFLERAPLELRKRVDVFGPAPESLAVMCALKARFDPEGRLAPGRFVGRL